MPEIGLCALFLPSSVRRRGARDLRCWSDVLFCLTYGNLPTCSLPMLLSLCFHNGQHTHSFFQYFLSSLETRLVFPLLPTPPLREPSRPKKYGSREEKQYLAILCAARNCSRATVALSLAAFLARAVYGRTWFLLPTATDHGVQCCHSLYATWLYATCWYPFCHRHRHLLIRSLFIHRRLPRSIYLGNLPIHSHLSFERQRRYLSRFPKNNLLIEYLFLARLL